MKRILFLLMALTMYDTSVYGTNLCVRNGAYVGVLYKDVNGTGSYNSDTTKKTWKVVFDYKTITGLAACNMFSGTRGQPKTNLYTNASDEGVHCWCKMEPVTDTVLNTDATTGLASYWVYAYQASTENDCATNCASTCANWIANNNKVDSNDDGFRVNLFEAIW